MSNHRSLLRLYWGDSTPQISSHLGGATSGDLELVDILRRADSRRRLRAFVACWKAFYEGAANAQLPATREAVKRKSRTTCHCPHRPHAWIQYQTLERKIVRDTPPKSRSRPYLKSDAPPAVPYVCRRRRGSSRSRRPSPRKLIPSTVSKIASPGKTAIEPATVR